MGFELVLILICVLPWMAIGSTFPTMCFQLSPTTPDRGQFLTDGLAWRNRLNANFPDGVWSAPRQPQWPSQNSVWSQGAARQSDMEALGGQRQSDLNSFGSSERSGTTDPVECSHQRAADLEDDKRQKSPTTDHPTSTPPPIFIYMPNPYIKSRSTHSADYIDVEISQLDYPESLVNAPDPSKANRDPKSFIVVPEENLVKLETTVALPEGSDEYAAESEPFQAILVPRSKPNVTEEPRWDRPEKNTVRSKSKAVPRQTCALKKGDLDFVNGQFVRVRDSRSKDNSNRSPKALKAGRYKMAMVGNVPVRVKNQDTNENQNLSLPIDIYSTKNIAYNLYTLPRSSAKSFDLSLVPRFFLSVNQNEPPVSPTEPWPYESYGAPSTQRIPSTFQTNIKNEEAINSWPHIEASERMYHNFHPESQNTFNYPRPPPNFAQELLHPSSKENLMYSKSLKSDVSPLSNGPEKTIYCRQAEAESSHESSIEWNCDKSEMKPHPLPPWVSIGTAGGNNHYPSNGITSLDGMNALNHNKFPCPVPSDNLQKPIVNHDSSQNDTKTKKQTVHSANSSLEPWKFGKPRKRRRAPTISKRDTSPDDYTDSSWPSFYDILERVHRNMTHVKRDEFFNYAWSPYALTYSSKHLAPTMKPPQPPSPPPLSNKAHRSNQTDLFVYRKVYAFNRSILAVSIRRTTTPSGVDTLKAEPAMTASTPVPDMAPVGNSTHSRHFKKPQEHFRALSAARARLHHRWLQKGNFKAKILT